MLLYELMLRYTFFLTYSPFTLPDPTDGTVYVFGPRNTDGAMDLMKKLSLNIPELVAKSPTRSSVDNSLCTGNATTVFEKGNYNSIYWLSSAADFVRIWFTTSIFVTENLLDFVRKFLEAAWLFRIFHISLAKLILIFNSFIAPDFQNNHSLVI